MDSAKYWELADILSPAISISKKSQQWVADKCGVTQVAVSGWLKGYKRPGRAHLAILVPLFDLDIKQVAKAASYDPSEIETLIDPNRIRRDDAIQLAKLHLDFVHRTRVQGQSLLADEMARSYARLLQRIEYGMSNAAVADQLRKARARLIFEAQMARKEMLPSKNIALAVKSLVVQIHMIAPAARTNR